jgi:hypothetical protein
LTKPILSAASAPRLFGLSIHIKATNTPDVRLDFTQGCIQRGVGAGAEVSHRVQGLSVKLNSEMLSRVFFDPADGPTEERGWTKGHEGSRSGAASRNTHPQR